MIYFLKTIVIKRTARHLSDTGRLVVPAGHDPATP